MQYNLHPLFVHFPVAMLFVYSIIKILPAERWFPTVAWKHIERALLVFGVAGAFLALATGDTAEHLSTASRPLIEMHSTFAGLATALYGALLAGEILNVINPKLLPKIKNKTLVSFLSWLEKILTNKIFSVVLAVLALVAITVTGLLGGVIVYGVSADPMAGIVVKMLGLNL